MDAEDRPSHPLGGVVGAHRERLPLTHHLVASSAVGFVEDHGLAALTMRRLASSLGVEAMSLYHYFPSRDALLDAMVEEWMDVVASPDLLAPAHPRDWRERMVAMAAAVRRAALSHPQTFPLVVDHGTDDLLYHPPLRRASWYEAVLLDLVAGGLGNVDAVVVCHRLADFLLGYLLSEAAQVRVLDGPVSRPRVQGTRVTGPRAHSAPGPRPFADPAWTAPLSRRQTDADFVRALDGLIRWSADLCVPADPEAAADVVRGSRVPPLDE